jgi:hypothetical protein
MRRIFDVERVRRLSVRNSKLASLLLVLPLSLLPLA